MIKLDDWVAYQDEELGCQIGQVVRRIRVSREDLRPSSAVSRMDRDICYQIRWVRSYPPDLPGSVHEDHLVLTSPHDGFRCMGEERPALFNLDPHPPADLKHLKETCSMSASRAAFLNPSSLSTIHYYSPLMAEYLPGGELRFNHGRVDKKDGKVRLGWHKSKLYEDLCVDTADLIRESKPGDWEPIDKKNALLLLAEALDAPEGIDDQE